MTRLCLIASLLIAAFLLGGCGIRGDLERPAPLWGETTLEPLPIVDGPEANLEANPDALPAPDVLDEEDAPGYGVDVAD